VRTNSRGTRGAFNGDDSPSLCPLRKRGLGARRACPQRQTEISLSCLWPLQPRESDSQRLPRSSSRGDSAYLSRTQQLAWPHSHIWGLSHHRVKLDQKKVAQLPPFHTTLVTLDPEEAASTILELDELWSFVLKKANDSWIWIALGRQTRQVVGYALGDRSKQTCLRLWESIPSAYRQGHCFTDFWGYCRCWWWIIHPSLLPA